MKKIAYFIIIFVVILSMTQKKEKNKSLLNESPADIINETFPKSYSGGGGGSSPTQSETNPLSDAPSSPPEPSSSTEVSIVQVINFNVDSVSINSTHSNITIYWEVENGVGCCATFDCDFDAYEEACLNPLRLYDLRLDGNVVDDTGIDFDYKCEPVTPWHERDIPYVSKGLHEVQIDVKDCVNTILEVTKVISVD